MYTDTKASSPNVRKCLSKLGICVRLARCLFHYKHILLHVLPYSSGWVVLDGIDRYRRRESPVYSFTESVL